jgi:hypothetical protein
MARAAADSSWVRCFPPHYLPLSLWLQAANLSGSSLPAPRALFLLATETQFGRVWLIPMALLIVIAVLVKRKPPANEPANPLALGPPRAKLGAKSQLFCRQWNY